VGDRPGGEADGRLSGGQAFTGFTSETWAKVRGILDCVKSRLFGVDARS